MVTRARYATDETEARGFGEAEYRGKSTDTKPTNAPTNSTFLELDTGDVYYIDEDKTWKPMGGGR